MNDAPITHPPLPITGAFDAPPTCIDPWPLVRAERPDAMLIRVIYTALDLQMFVEIPRNKATYAAGLDMYDGATSINPAGNYTLDERAAIIRAADIAWTPSATTDHGCPAT